MAIEPSDLTSAEYAALRATIRERGSVRLLVIGLTIATWAGLLALAPQGGLLVRVGSLLVLACGFELVFAAHVAVERIGRYIQHYYESDGLAQAPAWEHVAMALGHSPGQTARSPDPLAGWLFASAAAVNLASGAGSVASGAAPGAGLLVLMATHGLFLWRIRRARNLAAAQRERDLRAIETLHGP